MSIEIPNPTQRQSVLIFFGTITAMLFLIIFMFNSLVIQNLIETYQQSQKSQELLEVGHLLFAAVRSYGFERGRTHILYNYQGNTADLVDFNQFIRQHRQVADDRLALALATIQRYQLHIESATLQQINELSGQLQELRRLSTDELAKPFIERNTDLNERRFEYLSRQMGAINYLLFSLKEHNALNIQQKSYIDIVYLLSLLRDQVGPSVSYFNAALFNPVSLTEEQLIDIQVRHSITNTFLEQLSVLAKEVLPSYLNEQVEQFISIYHKDIFLTQQTFRQPTQPLEPKQINQFLQRGVQALERLQQISEQVIHESNHYFNSQQQLILIKLATSVALSLLVLGVLIYNFRLIYHNIYQRIVNVAETMNHLSNNQIDLTITPPILNDELGDMEAGLQQFHCRLLELNQINQRLEQLSQQDSMTSLLNHAHILQQLVQLHQDALYHHYTYAVLMIDIDLFKQVNDTYGHPVGDEVILEVAELLTENSRKTDQLGRYGGEEFMLLLPHTTLTQGQQIAHKLRERVDERRFSHLQLAITISIGVATLSRQSASEEVVKQADIALYQAKTTGRNRVCCMATDQESDGG